MKEQIGKLLRLQSLDLRMVEMEKDRNGFPAEERAAEKQLEEKQRELGVIEEEIAQAMQIRRSNEAELESNGEKIRKFNGQLFEVKTNREYTALQGEIQTLNRADSDLEEKILISMDEVEAQEKIRDKLRVEADGLEKNLDQVKKRLEEAEKEIAVLMQEAGSERKEAVEGLDSHLLRKYETINRAKRGSAVSAIERGACQICNRAIPPQRIIEVKKMQSLILCEGCGRILAWRE